VTIARTTTDGARRNGGERLTALEMGAWAEFLRTHAMLVRELDDELRRTHGLPLSSYDVLAQLGDTDERRMRMSELADAVLLSRSGLTRLVERLERDGLLERADCPGDARGSYAVLTDAGAERLHRARVTHLAGVRERFLEQLEDAELEALGGYWERIQAASPSDPPGRRR
jgi:DNA-binding MarR family transcriptional regulator